MKHALGAPQPAEDRKQGKRRGATLLVSIAILTLLAVFSIAFVQLVNFERRASANYIDAVRARMAARAGIQRAVAELQRIATLKHYSDPRPVGDGGDGWAYSYRRPEKEGGDSLGRPPSLLTTLRPSFRMTDTSRNLFGKPLEFSGSISSSYQGGIDLYKLKVIDASSQLNLNHPDDASLTRMLFSLFLCAAEQDADAPAWSLSEDQARQLAERVVQRRPEGGFRSVSEVEAILAEPILGANSTSNVVVPAGTPGLPAGTNRWLHPDREGLRLPLRDMLTVSSWVDDTVIRPWNRNGQGLRDLFTEPRAPININTAPLPVLTAALAGISGAGRFGSATLSYDSAKDLATLIRARVAQATGGGPFRTWLEFERWIDEGPWTPGGSGPARPGSTPLAGGDAQSVGGSALGGGSTIASAISTKRQLQRDLVKAALNPNTMLNKWGAHPNHGGSRHPAFALPRLLDKSDLTRHGTEGCFDSMGIYDITSLGMVLVANEREPTSPGLLILAEQTQQVVVRVYDVLRMSTQADFETNRALHAAGDFVEAFDRKWTYTVLGVNKPLYGPAPPTRPFGFEGWPGVTSLPVYSLHRDVIDTNWRLRPEYVAADWDGQLMLSNLLAVPVQPADFVVCLARGQFEAFKVRAWWEPKDQNPSSGDPLDPSNPTRGVSDLAALAAPLGYQPRRAGVESNESNPLDAVSYGAAASVSTPAWFNEGSALTPHGAIIHPDRQSSPGKPSVLVYDGDNIDLIQGTSIRFWVMPTDDPFAQTQEVLFSFIGCRDGRHRDVGFRVVKRAFGGAVRIFLETINRARTDANDTNDVRTGSGSGLGSPTSISIDVTPDEGVVPNPLRPQWTPGSWHWVVVNFGPQTSIPNVSQTAVLQIDKARGTALGTDIINMAVAGNGGPVNYGAAHGNQGGDGVLPGGSLNINRRGVVAWVGDRLLGEWYHCDLNKTVEPNDDERRFPNAVRWDPNDGGGAGGYVISPGFPSNPFPDGSYNRKLKLRFRADGASPNDPPPVPDAEMTPANGSGMGGTGWTYTFRDVEMGPDLTGGTSDDYKIDIIATWTTDTPSGGGCSCCSDCGTHDMTRKRYWGRNNDNGGSICYMIHKGPGEIVAGGRLPPPDTIPLQFTCDQCHGCEECKVNGPMWFGGEPSGRQNQTAGGVLEGVNPLTTARAIFDNIVIKNNKERRTDSPGGGGELPGKDFEDRFFETSLATATGSAQWNGGADLNFGAVYRRGLLEVVGVRARLGTLSWTSYPTGDGDYDFQAALYRMPGSGGVSNYDPGNPGPLDTTLGQPPTGALYTMTLNGKTHQIGYTFKDEGIVDTTSNPMGGGETLVLSVQFSKLLSDPNDRAADDSGGPGGKLYPQPLVETPIFEDVTLTLLLESPQVLYAEEGVEE